MQRGDGHHKRRKRRRAATAGGAGDGGVAAARDAEATDVEGGDRSTRRRLRGNRPCGPLVSSSWSTSYIKILVAK